MSRKRHPERPADSGEDGRPWALLLVGLASFLVFLPALRNGFLNWDDRKMLLENPFYRGLGWAQLRWMFTTTYFCNYQPLSWLSYAFDFLLWGMNPAGYHLTGALLHSANAALFYCVALRLLPRTPGASRELGASFAALFFALHPLRVESVAWAAERRDVLSAFFFLASVLCHLRACAAEEKTGRRLWRSLALAGCLAALLSKVTAVALPAVLVLLDFHPLGRLPPRPRDWLSRPHAAVWREKIPYLLFSLAAAIVGIYAQAGCSAMVSLEDYGVKARLIQSLFGTAFYLWKTLVPLRLSPLYEWSSLLDPGPLFLAAAAVAAATALFLSLRRRWPSGLAAWVYYLTVLSPMLGLFKSGRQIAADRYTYLSCLGWALLAGGALKEALDLREGRYRPLVLAAAAAVLGALGFLTARQLEVWRDSVSLWSQAARAVPGSYFAHKRLSASLAEAGRDGEARREMELGLRIQFETHDHAGAALYEQGRTEEAVRQLGRALQINPAAPFTHNNLGLALCRLGRTSEAIEHYRKALELKPDYAEARENLERALKIRTGGPH